MNAYAPWPQFIERFSIEYCRRHRLIGVQDANGDNFLIGDSQAVPAIVDCVGRLMGSPLSFRSVEHETLVTITNEAYEATASKKSSSEGLTFLNDDLQQSETLASHDDLLESENRGQVVELVNSILLKAIKLGASDVHLQPLEDRLVVRMRIDGVLIDVRELRLSAQDEVVSRIKVAAKMNIAEKRLPQDGRSTVRVGERIIDLRLSSMPTAFGEQIVIRLLDKSARLYRLPDLGMDEWTQKGFREVIHYEHGLILVTGPTGSGKSTTLYAALQELNTREKNAITLEDPIEYQLSGISQTQINTKKGMTFAKGLRSVLRQDPDIIMVGEIRDEETAIMAVQAALTGHLVFSTLHTNDATSAIARLLDLGIEPYLVASSLLAVLAQRLVRCCCPRCSTGAGIEDGERNMGRTECSECGGSGFRGREGIYELLLVNDAIRGLVQQRSHSSEIRKQALSDGMRLLIDSGQEKVRLGRTTDAELHRVTMRTSL